MQEYDFSKIKEKVDLLSDRIGQIDKYNQTVLMQIRTKMFNNIQISIEEGKFINDLYSKLSYK